jgi:predicted nucleic-acid-binding protein
MLVIMEATGVLTAVYGLSHAEIATAIEMLLHHRELTIQESDGVATALEQYRSRPALGFSDCLILQTARKAGTFRWDLRPKSLQTRRSRRTVALYHLALSEK